MDERCLFSRNHGEQLLSYFQTLRKTQRFTDVTVHCDGELVGVGHRIVLAAFSKHFETALSGVQGSATVTLDIDSKILNIKITELRRIVDFIYSGQTRVADSGALLAASKTLGISFLVSALQQITFSPTSPAVVENADHAQQLLEATRRFYLDNKFTDVHIVCQGIPLTACHRLVLCAYSQHFESALQNTENCAMVTLDIDSAITGVTSVDLRTLVDFMYNGELRVSRRRIKSLSSAAAALGVRKLVALLGTQQRPSIEVNLPQSVTRIPKYEDRSLSKEPQGLLQSRSGRSDPYLLSPAEFDIETVGATEDVGTPLLDTALSVVDDFGDGNGRELTAQDDYVEIYEEYVSGPRRGRKGGSYGRKPDPWKFKGPPVSLRDLRNPEQNLESDLGTLLDSSLLKDNETPKLSESTSPNMDNSGNGDNLLGAPDHSSRDDLQAVTMSFLPRGRKRKTTDAFGYGLPEIMAANDVTVPLLVGDQQAMMEKPFKCPYCDHRTREKSAVEKHIRCIHTLEAPYKCRYCSQAFKVQSNLVRHVRAHTGEKPYVCKKCGAAYADKKNMDAHVFREHLKMKPLECPSTNCNAKFWRQDRFNYHCRRQHSFEPDMLQQRLDEDMPPLGELGKGDQSLGDPLSLEDLEKSQLDPTTPPTSILLQ